LLAFSSSRFVSRPAARERQLLEDGSRGRQLQALRLVVELRARPVFEKPRFSVRRELDDRALPHPAEDVRAVVLLVVEARAERRLGGRRHEEGIGAGVRRDHAELNHWTNTA
jgi:hypothetical protein